MLKPYVGITGFMDRKEVECCLMKVPKNSDRLLMTGILASRKTIRGLGNSYPLKYPRREQFSKLVINDPRIFSCVHFSTDEPDFLYDDLMRCAEYAGENLRGFQTNIVWPDALAIARVKKQLPKTRFILQISPTIIGWVKPDVIQLVISVNRMYGALFDDIIIDGSGGKGIKMSLDTFLKYANAFDHEHSNFGLVACGGLSDNNVVEIIKPLVEKFPKLSIDAEGALRIGPYGGNLNLERAKKYLEKAFGLWTE